MDIMINVEIKLIILFAAKDGEEIQYRDMYRDTVKAKARLGADCAKFRLKLKKVGKTTRSLRYEVNQIAYNNTVQVRNRLKGLDLIEYLKKYGQRL